MVPEELADILHAKLSLGDRDTTDSNTEEISPSETSASKRAHICESKPWLACKHGSAFGLEWYLDHASTQEVSQFVSARDKNGNTALIVASAATHAYGACKQIIQTLLKKGADINAKNRQGRTALMEASLWGGLAAVTALLKPLRGSPADPYLKDNSGIMAIQLASTSKDYFLLERRERCNRGENTEQPLDNLCRSRIVNLLQKTCVGENTSTTVQHNTVALRLDIETNYTKDRVARLEEELGKQVDELRQVKEELRQVKEDMDFAKHQVVALPNCRSDKNIHFQVTELQDGTLETQVDIVRTFRFDPPPNRGTKIPKHSRPTIAYMDINGHLARNGKLQEEHFIDSHWVKKAHDLFHKLGSDRKETWFQHAEPKLMALCMDHFLKKTNLSVNEFRNKQPVKSGIQHGLPKVVEILVSRAPCPACEEHKNLVNKFTREYNFEFLLTYANVF